MHTPGLKVVCPSTPYDAKGLLLAAIRDDNPVIFLEHKLLYGGKGTRKEKRLDRTRRRTCPRATTRCRSARVAVRRRGHGPDDPGQHADGASRAGRGGDAGAEGIEAEVIDVRCLVPLDMDTVTASVAETGRLLIVEEDHLTGGWGAEVLARIAESHFHLLNGPIRRVAAPDTPLPCAAALERAYVPDVERIVAAVRDLVARAD